MYVNNVYPMYSIDHMQKDQGTGNKHYCTLNVFKKLIPYQKEHVWIMNLVVLYVYSLQSSEHSKCVKNMKIRLERPCPYKSF